MSDRRKCDACFLECEKGRSARNGGTFPCSMELRKWAKRHRNDPAGMVIEGRRRK